jgi:DNA-binding transcriptional regulator YiaG
MSLLYVRTICHVKKYLDILTGHPAECSARKAIMEWFEEMLRIRTACDLSQEQTAQRLRVTTRTYSRWEKGEPKKPKLRELAEMRGWKRKPKG